MVLRPEAPPDIDELRTGLYLVHVTTEPPANDVIRAAAQDYTHDGHWHDADPPAFRPTIHTSIGESFNSGSDDRGFSRNDRPVAIVMPLEAVESQLLNIFPNDTILLGDTKVDHRATIILSESTPYDGAASVVRYTPGNLALAKTVDNVIRASDGWNIRTDMFLDGPHSFASVTQLEDMPITQDFFSALLRERPTLSYGSHFHSVTGDAWRSGVADYLIAECISRYSDTMTNQISTEELRLYRELIAGHIDKFVVSVLMAGYEDAVLETVQGAKVAAASWLNVLDVDLYARDQLGLTLTGAPPQIWEQIKQSRTEPEALRRAVVSNRKELRPDYKLSSSMNVAAQLSASMSPEEYHDVAARHSHFASAEVVYAVTRWLLVGNEQAAAEGLDRIVEGLGAREQATMHAIARAVLPYFKGENDRQAIARTIVARTHTETLIQSDPLYPFL